MPFFGRNFPHTGFSYVSKNEEEELLKNCNEAKKMAPQKKLRSMTL